MTEDLIDKLVFHFTSKGFMECSVDSIDPSSRPEIAFKKGESRVFIYIIDIDSLSGKGAIMKKIARAITNEHSNLTYLAIPSEIESSIDSGVLNDCGVGLLVVDDEVREVIPAKNRVVKPMKIGEELMERIRELESKISKFERAIVELESMISRVSEARTTGESIALSEKIASVERRIEAIEEEMLDIKRKLNMLEEKLERRRAEVAEIPVEAVEEVKAEISVEGLPSFFKDNPWVNILSTRGRRVEEHK